MNSNLILSGIKEIDSVINSIPSGKLGIIYGLTGCGKTSLGLKIASNVAKQNKHVLYYSREEKYSSLMDKFLMIEYGFDPIAFNKAKTDFLLTEYSSANECLKIQKNIYEQTKEQQEYLSSLKELSIDFCFDEYIENIYDRLIIKDINEKKYDLVIVDFLQIMNSLNPNNYSHSYMEKLSFITNYFNYIAEKHDIAIILCAQAQKHNIKNDYDFISDRISRPANYLIKIIDSHYNSLEKNNKSKLWGNIKCHNKKLY